MPPTQIPQALESLPEIPKAQQVTGDFFETRELIVCSIYQPVYSVCKKNATIALTSARRTPRSPSLARRTRLTETIAYPKEASVEHY